MASGLGNTPPNTKSEYEGGRGRRKLEGLGRHKERATQAGMIWLTRRSDWGQGRLWNGEKDKRERLRKSAVSTQAVTERLPRGTAKVKETSSRKSIQWWYKVQREEGEGNRREKNNWSYSIWQLVDRFKPAMPLRDYVLEPEAVRHTDYSLTHPHRNGLCFVIDKSLPGTVLHMLCHNVYK